jgi:hypothetical protein
VTGSRRSKPPRFRISAQSRSSACRATTSIDGRAARFSSHQLLPASALPHLPLVYHGLGMAPPDRRARLLQVGKGNYGLRWPARRLPQPAVVGFALRDRCNHGVSPWLRHRHPRDSNGLGLSGWLVRCRPSVGTHVEAGADYGAVPLISRSSGSRRYHLDPSTPISPRWRVLRGSPG